MTDDMQGNPIEVDDLMVFPVQVGYSSYLRVGKVTEVIEKPSPTRYDKNRVVSSVRMEWLYGGDYNTPKTSIMQHPARGMILPPDWLADPLGGARDGRP